MPKRIVKPELLALAGTLLASAGLIALPPWKARAISVERHRRVLTRQDFSRILGAMTPDIGWTSVDTLTWTIPFRSILNAPTVESHAIGDDFDREIQKLLTDSSVTGTNRGERISALAARYEIVRKARDQSLRLPALLLEPQFRTDTSGVDVYNVSRDDRVEFWIDTPRLFASVTVVLLIGSSAVVLFRAFQRSL
jgi:hypothetical protein